MPEIVKCTECGDDTTNSRTRKCDVCNVKRLVERRGDRNYEKWISTR